MPNSGDVVDLDLGLPAGREVGFIHPAIIVTSQRILDLTPSVVHVVPMTTTIRDFESEIQIEPDENNGLTAMSSAQCQHLRAISPQRLAATRGNIGPTVLFQIREAIAIILDIPI